MLALRCPECDRRLKVPLRPQEYKVKCPYCSAKFIVPAESAVAEQPIEPTAAAATPTKLPPVIPAPIVPPPPIIRPASKPAVDDPGDDEPSSVTSTTDAVSRSIERKTPPPPSRSKSSRQSVPEDDYHEVPFSRPSMTVDPEELIDMTAMVDIVFFLLIFFLVTSMQTIHSSARMPRPEGDEEKVGARAISSDTPKNDSDAIIVTIKKDDSIEIEGVPYRDLAELTVRLRQLKNANGAETSLVIHGHGDATHGTAVSILDAGYEVGIDKLRLSVLGESSE